MEALESVALAGNASEARPGKGILFAWQRSSGPAKGSCTHCGGLLSHARGLCIKESGPPQARLGRKSELRRMHQHSPAAGAT